MRMYAFVELALKLCGVVVVETRIVSPYTDIVTNDRIEYGNLKIEYFCSGQFLCVRMVCQTHKITSVYGHDQPNL